MEIKLKACLKAYGRFNKLLNPLPTPSKDDAHSFLGVDSEGNYTLFKNANEEHIDTLFDETSENNVSNSRNNKLIESLF